MNLKQWRAEEGITIREAAQRCGINPRSWERMEFGYGKPSIDAAHKIITGSGGKVTLADLVGQPKPGA